MLVAGMLAAMAAAMMAPVEVPAANEKVSRAGRPVVPRAWPERRQG
jgi:hypothetical protein